MSANAGSSGESNLPPLPHERLGAGAGRDLLKTLLPSAIALGVGAAALTLLEQKTGSVSRNARRAGSRLGDAADYAGETAHDWWDSASGSASEVSHHLKDDLLRAGAKAAGLLGVLQAIGGGRLSSNAQRALKALAVKKAVAYAGRAGSRGARYVKNHPKASAAGAYGVAKTRSMGHRAADRWDEWRHRLTGQPRRRKEDETASTVVAALVVLGLGAVAFYLFSTSPRGQRTWTTAQRRTAHGIKQARKQAEHLGETISGTVGGSVSETLHSGLASVKERAQSAVEQARSAVTSRVPGASQEARNDEQIVSDVRRAIHERLSGTGDAPVEVQVSCSDGRVTVSGNLDEAHQDLAKAAASSVSGVREVSVTRDDSAKL